MPRVEADRPMICDRRAGRRRKAAEVRRMAGLEPAKARAGVKRREENMSAIAREDVAEDAEGGADGRRMPVEGDWRMVVSDV